MLYENGDMINNTLYTDTIELDQGCFNLRIDDLGGDGLQFWANMPPYGNGTAGYAKIYNMNNQLIHTFQADFGNYIQQDFSVGMALNAHENRDAGFIEAYPNPTNGIFRLSLKLKTQQNIEISIFDAYGNQIKNLLMENIDDCHQVFDLGNEKDGIYFCTIKTNEGVITKKIMLIR